jgi:hypothetical protein
VKAALIHADRQTDRQTSLALLHKFASLLLLLLLFFFFFSSFLFFLFLFFLFLFFFWVGPAECTAAYLGLLYNPALDSPFHRQARSTPEDARDF